MRVCFVLQNETHAWNAAALIEMLNERSPGKYQFNVLALDKIMHMETAQYVPETYVKIPPISATTAFYRMGGIQRVRWLSRASRALKAALGDADVLVIGCDGAIQRLLAREVHKRGGRVVLLLDGLISPWDKAIGSVLKRTSIRVAKRWAESFGLGHYAPSLLAHSRLDRIFVMDQVVADELRRQGVRVPIQTVALPRFKKFIETYCAAKSSIINDGKLRLLYATSAYSWHGLHVEEQWQKNDIADLLHMAKSMPNISVKIRVHPREEKSFYESIILPDNVEIGFSGTPLAEDLAWSTLMLTTRSSATFEAGMVGVPCVISTGSFPAPPQRSYWAQAHHITIVSQYAEILDKTFLKNELPIHICDQSIFEYFNAL